MKDDKYLAMTSSFVARAEELLATGKKANLFYAALEVRMGIEARLQTYVHAHEEISRQVRNGWKISELSKTLERSGKWATLVSEVEVISQGTGGSLSKLHYVPVSAELRQIGARLGDFLHYREGPVTRDESWWARLLETVERGVRDLRVCAQATLLGPPLVNKADASKVDLKMEFHPDDPRFAALSALAEGNARITLKVSYFTVSEFYELNR